MIGANMKNLSLRFWYAVVVSVFLLSCSTSGKNTRDQNVMLTACQNKGWSELKFKVGEQDRRLLYKMPVSEWSAGAILVLHGGGGQAEHFCDDSLRLVRPQVRFTEMALEQNFAVFALDSTADVKDDEGYECGKIWDDQLRTRANLDLPYLEHIIKNVVPSLRKQNDNKSIFMTGLSSGGYMTVRAASNLGHLLTAFAPLSNGDPYGWHRKCDPKYGNKRENVKGAGFDNETGKEIIELNSCQSSNYKNEKKWDSYKAEKPQFRLFHSSNDGINDYSCGQKVEKQLRAHGFKGEETYLLKNDGGRRRIINHFWHDEYNSEILAFFKRQLK